MKKTTLIFSIFLATFFVSNSFAQNAAIDSIRQNIERDIEREQYILNTEDVVITKLITNITIDTSGYFDVEENYQVVFNEERRGLLRFLVLKYVLNIEENYAAEEKSYGDMAMSILFPEVNTRRIIIENIEVPERNFSVSGNHILSNELEIKIGDEFIYLEGEQEYTIKYRVKNAFLFREHSTDFYWNFLGGNWDIPFLSAEFNVFLQGGVALDSNRYYLYAGEVGKSKEWPNLNYRTDTLFGISPFILDKYEDMTLLLHLPTDYIPRPSETAIFWSRYSWPLLPGICILTFLLLWFFIGRDKILVKQVQYNPPADVDSALAGFLIDSRSNDRDIISLLPYWASQGVITMKEENLPSALNKTGRMIVIGFVIALLLSSILIPGYFLLQENEIGFAFLPVLFVLVILGPAIVKWIKRFRKVPKDMLITKLKPIPGGAKNYERKVFEGLFKGNKSSVKVSELKNKFYSDLYDAKEQLKEAGLKKGYTKNSERNLKRTRIFLSLAMILGGIGLFILFHLPAAIVHTVVCIILLIFAKVMDKRTSFGDDLMKDLIGFRTFIDKADKPKLEFLLKEDPNYFEKTISYAVAFGMADKWCKKFEHLTAQPTWYKSTDKDSHSFGSSFNNILRTATVNLTSAPSSSGSGGSSSSFGGGSSGGGFGGGGGSSW